MNNLKNLDIIVKKIESAWAADGKSFFESYEYEDDEGNISSPVVDGYQVVDVETAEQSCGAECCGYFIAAVTLLTPSGDKVVVNEP